MVARDFSPWNNGILFCSSAQRADAVFGRIDRTDVEPGSGETLAQLARVLLIGDGANPNPARNPFTASALRATRPRQLESYGLRER